MNGPAQSAYLHVCSVLAAFLCSQDPTLGGGLRLVRMVNDSTAAEGPPQLTRWSVVIGYGYFSGRSALGPLRFESSLGESPSRNRMFPDPKFRWW